MTCKEKNCEKPVAAKDWCWMHYRRFLRHGDVNQAMSMKEASKIAAHTRWNKPLDKATDYETLESEPK